jgi:hypothetical protein
VQVYDCSEAVLSDFSDHPQTSGQAASPLTGRSLKTKGANVRIGGIESGVDIFNEGCELEVRPVAFERSEVGRIENRFAEVPEADEEDARPRA